MDHFLCIRYILWLYSVTTITLFFLLLEIHPGRIFKLCHLMPWITALLGGKALESANGNLDPNNFKEFVTVCVYVWKFSRWFSAQENTGPSSQQALEAPWKSICMYDDNYVSLGKNLFLILLYLYTERDRGCSTELYFYIAWKKTHDLCWSEESLHN